ncbi:sporulation integral membrane protein YlbJ [Bacillus sp. DX1.1]|uniref:sporulation integral membrane protein YlbJ n=1 Tax=unclassified Bacillus (in: firmicutes) TaxID=185979 RepID=UPI00256FB460|nr:MULTISPECIES: sporulation integral membrane protein YlbJ [unclassified Bacillus (in: firmicutes)]MDM5156114.1 sporulation integral membrane protein YlbJ [Bacillus sp. DX1.1]WJE80401.1 sporulation integral membrane protein YlbJ [Bacillus sp. DX3.1]
MYEKWKTAFLTIAMMFLTFSLVLHPQAALQSSIRGLNIWWEVVFPSLLPFFIVAELLISIGVVKFIGILLEPLMRPLFRVPGIGGFVWAMGMASGFPAGAKLSARLRQSNQLTQTEAERLVSFTNSSNPLFIFGAVSIGFFNNPRLGLILAAAHYISNFAVGLLMRFYGNKTKYIKTEKRIQKRPLQHAFSILHETRLQEKRPIGKLLGDAIISSIQTLLMIGGFIILFSVLSKMITVFQVTAALSFIMQQLLIFFQISPHFSTPILSGLFEMTLGSQMISQINQTTILEQAMVTSFILAFSGLSIQAQVASILAETDIRFKPYFFARIIQSILAPIFTLIFWKPLYENLHSFSPNQEDVPVFLSNHSSVFLKGWDLLITYGPAFTLFCLYLYVTLLFLRLMNKEKPRSS